MDDIGMIGFALGGLPQFEGNGGPGGGEERSSKLKELETAVNSFLESLGIEKLSEEKVAELLFYVTEKQIDRWTELLDFFFNEAAALLLEAMEALDGGEGGSDEQQ